MGLVSSKDETGAVMAGSGKDILDYEGRDLRDKMDVCLSKYMWFWTIGGVLVSLPLCVYTKSQKPVFAAALVCPIGDMMYATSKCYPEKEAFAAHFKMLQQKRAIAIQKVLADEGAPGSSPLQAAASDTAAADLPQFVDQAAASRASVGGNLSSRQEDGELKLDKPREGQAEGKRKGWW